MCGLSVRVTNSLAFKVLVTQLRRDGRIQLGACLRCAAIVSLGRPSLRLCRLSPCTRGLGLQKVWNAVEPFCGIPKREWKNQSLLANRIPTVLVRSRKWCYFPPPPTLHSQLEVPDTALRVYSAACFHEPLVAHSDKCSFPTRHTLIVSGPPSPSFQGRSDRLTSCNCVLPHPILYSVVSRYLSHPAPRLLYRIRFTL